MNVSRFVKYHGRTVLKDRWRLEALSQVCGQVDGVVTAPVRHVDIERREIVYERLRLESPLGGMTSRPEIFEKVGGLLARMHMAKFSVYEAGFTRSPCPMRQLGIDQATGELLAEAIPEGWFHSDFWHGNVFILDEDKVAVIDPIPAPFFTPQNYILACGALDVAMMYMSILVVHPLAKQLSLKIMCHVNAAEAFMEGYLKFRGMYSSDLIHPLRKASHALARRWVSCSSRRLARPVHVVKSLAAYRLMHNANNIIAWGKS